MKKIKVALLAVIFISIAFSFTPAVVPQIGTYTFHGAAGNEKILEVRVADNSSLENLFGPSYAPILESFFEPGCLIVGAQSKSLVTAVNFTAKFDPTTYLLPTPGPIVDVTEYNTSNWGWTVGAFSPTPPSIGDIVISFYNPTELTQFINSLYITWGGVLGVGNIPYNISTHTAGAFLAQLPTDVAQYLGAFVWEPDWTNIGSTIVHSASALDFIFGTAVQYLEDCTEIWTYDTTYGAWIGYQILDENATKIYEFSIEYPAGAAIPGFELTIILGTTVMTSIGLIYVLMKKKN